MYDLTTLGETRHVLDRVRREPHHDAGRRTCEHRRERRELRARDPVGLQLLLHEILVREELASVAQRT